jgi:hypothetical protein
MITMLRTFIGTDTLLIIALELARMPYHHLRQHFNMQNVTNRDILIRCV